MERDEGIWRVADGLLAEHRLVRDNLTTMTQLRLLEPGMSTAASLVRR